MKNRKCYKCHRNTPEQQMTLAGLCLECKKVEKNLRTQQPRVVRRYRDAWIHKLVEDAK